MRRFQDDSFTDLFDAVLLQRFKEVDDDDDDDDEEDEEDLFLFDSLLSLLTGIDFGFLYLFTVPNLPNFASVIKSLNACTGDAFLTWLRVICALPFGAMLQRARVRTWIAFDFVFRMVHPVDDVFQPRAPIVVFHLPVTQPASAAPI